MTGCGGGAGVGDLKPADTQVVMASPSVPTGYPVNAPVVVQVSPTEHIDVLISEGQTLTLYAQVTGAPPLTYYWKFQNTLLPGPGTEVLVIKNFNASNVGTYSLSVGNVFQSKVISKGVTVRLVGTN